MIAYELLYFGAGMLVYPYIADFYATRRLPPVGLLAGLAAFRALLFVVWTWPLLRLAPRHAPWLVGLGFAIIAGIAPLLPGQSLHAGRRPLLPRDRDGNFELPVRLDPGLAAPAAVRIVRPAELRASTGSA